MLQVVKGNSAVDTQTASKEALSRILAGYEESHQRDMENRYQPYPAGPCPYCKPRCPHCGQPYPKYQHEVWC